MSSENSTNSNPPEPTNYDEFADFWQDQKFHKADEWTWLPKSESSVKSSDLTEQASQGTKAFVIVPETVEYNASDLEIIPDGAAATSQFHEIEGEARDRSAREFDRQVLKKQRLVFWFKRKLTLLLRTLVFLFLSTCAFYFSFPYVVPALLEYFLVGPLEKFEANNVEWDVLNKSFYFGQIRGKEKEVKFEATLRIDYEWGGLAALAIKEIDLFGECTLPGRRELLARHAIVKGVNYDLFGNDLDIDSINTSVAIVAPNSSGTNQRNANIESRLDQVSIEGLRWNFGKNILSAQKLTSSRSDVVCERDLNGDIWLAGFNLTKKSKAEKEEEPFPLTILVDQVGLDDIRATWRDRLSPDPRPIKLFGDFKIARGLQIVGKGGLVRKTDNSFQIHLGFQKDPKPLSIDARLDLAPPRISARVERAAFDKFPLSSLGALLKMLPPQLGLKDIEGKPLLFGALKGTLKYSPEGLIVDAQTVEPIKVIEAGELVAELRSLELHDLRVEKESFFVSSAQGKFSLVVEDSKEKTRIAALSFAKPVTGGLKRSRLEFDFALPKGAQITERRLLPCPWSFSWALYPNEIQKDTLLVAAPTADDAIFSGWVLRGQIAIPDEESVNLSGDCFIRVKDLSTEILKGQSFEPIDGKTWPTFSGEAWGTIAVVNSGVVVDSLELTDLSLKTHGVETASMSQLLVNQFEYDKKLKRFRFGKVDLNGLGLNVKRQAKHYTMGGFRWRHDLDKVGAALRSGKSARRVEERNVEIGPIDIKGIQLSYEDEQRGWKIRDLGFQARLPQGIMPNKDFEAFFQFALEDSVLKLDSIIDPVNGAILGTLTANRLPRWLARKGVDFLNWEKLGDIQSQEIAIDFEWGTEEQRLLGDVEINHLSWIYEKESRTLLRTLKITDFVYDFREDLLEGVLLLDKINLPSMLRDAKVVEGRLNNTRLQAEKFRLILGTRPDLFVDGLDLQNEDGLSLLKAARIELLLPAKTGVKRMDIKVERPYLDLIISKEYAEFCGVRVNFREVRKRLKEEGQGGSSGSEKEKSATEKKDDGLLYKLLLHRGRLKLREQAKDKPIVTLARDLQVTRVPGSLEVSMLLEGQNESPFRRLTVKGSNKGRGFDVQKLSLSKLKLDDLETVIERHTDYEGVKGTIDLESKDEDPEKLHLTLDKLKVRFANDSLAGKQLAAGAAAFLLTNGDFFFLQPDPIEIDIPKSALGLGPDTDEAGLSGMTGELIKLGVKAAIKPLLSPATFVTRLAAEGVKGIIGQFDDDEDETVETNQTLMVDFFPASTQLTPAGEAKLIEVSRVYQKGVNANPKLTISLTSILGRTDRARIQAAYTLQAKDITTISNRLLGRCRFLEIQRTKILAELATSNLENQRILKGQLRLIQRERSRLREEVRILLNLSNASGIERKDQRDRQEKELHKSRLKVIQAFIAKAGISGDCVEVLVSGQDRKAGRVEVEIRGD
ncbi:MAG: hypothetical protein P1V97_16450 [Planctomycetota bacterium]|nr:hypothetical protein [Planctomycetota bacterium]